MKLLPKNEVDLKKAEERKGSVDEGVKLARKIDALREAASDEETRFSKFRIASLAILHKEIDSLIEKKKILEESITTLSEEKKRLQLAIESAKDY